MRVGVIGTGHVGLVTCATFAAWGHDVVGVDQDEEKIEGLNRGDPPFFEPGLEELVGEGLRNGNLVFGRETRQAIEDAQTVFICVGTPPRASGEANLVAVEAAATAVARYATGPTVVVEKSTVPAGTAARVNQTLGRERPERNVKFAVASNPEFLREGRAIEDSLHPERILVGADDPWAFEVLRALYEPLTKRGIRLIETDIATAELAKHASNAFLALKISFANALARLCERSGGDVVAVADIMGSDSRIGRDFLDAGIGYGGYCFPKDLQAFERLSSELGYDFGLLREIVRINEEACDAVFQKVREAVWNLEDKRVALLGLSFKPNTDDVRLSPALEVARRLIEAGSQVVAYDPQALANAKTEVPELEVAPDPYEAAAGAHCAVLCTDWDEFRALDLGRLKQAMAYPTLVDGRNLFDPARMKQAGFAYYATGRPAVT